MKSTLANLRSPAIISLALVIPFIILEALNRRNFDEGFPIPLFGFIWLLPMIFTLTVTRIVRNVWAGKGLLGVLNCE
jgi:hypothetical protein